MGESEQVGHGSGVEAIIEKIAVSKGRVVGEEVAAGRKDGLRLLAHGMARPVRVLFYCSVVIGILLLVLLCVGVAFFGFLVFFF
ncbi:hypothetical protein [Nocardia australiensis]|uniref:hypothetical protein n=1 Tax=Nocardia australiensis TaxID=2887191 RepID=UPI001D140281|nr:hypothetical protein [Nocardia australiensis]